MKKLFPIAAVAALALMFTSCKKDYSCECTTTITGSSTTTTTTHSLGKQKKKDAESACKALSVTVSGVGGTTCSLK